MTPKWFPIGILVCGVLMLASRYLPDVKPSPDPPRTVTHIDVLFANEADLVIVACQAAIQKLQDGTLSTDQQARDWLASAMREAHNQTWRPVAESDAKAFADGWSAERHVKRLQEMLAEVRR